MNASLPRKQKGIGTARAKWQALARLSHELGERVTREDAEIGCARSTPASEDGVERSKAWLAIAWTCDASHVLLTRIRAFGSRQRAPYTLCFFNAGSSYPRERRCLICSLVESCCRTNGGRVSSEARIGEIGFVAVCDRADRSCRSGSSAKPSCKTAPPSGSHNAKRKGATQDAPAVISLREKVTSYCRSGEENSMKGSPRHVNRVTSLAKWLAPRERAASRARSIVSTNCGKPSSIATAR